MAWGGYVYRPGERVYVKNGGSVKEYIVESSEVRYVPGSEDDGPCAFYVSECGHRFTEYDIVENLLDLGK